MKKEIDYDHLKVIGCLCYASPHKKPSDKFAARGLRCILVGYPHNQKGYKLLDLHNKRIFVSRDVVFKEHIFPFLLKKDNDDFSDVLRYDDLYNNEDFACSNDISDEIGEQGLLHTEAVEETNTTRIPQDIPDDNAHQQVEERRSHRGSTLPKKYQDFIVDMPKRRSNDHDANLITANLADSSYYSIDYLASLCNVLSVREPSHYEEACQDEGWVQAMNSEIKALVDNATWEMVDLPPDKKALDSKWVYKIKFTPEGHVDKLKARLVARGDRQVEGKDYKHTFSLDAKFASVRVLITLVTALNWPLHQLDINNAFLHGHLDEEVYLKPPKGFQGGKEGQVCRLKKSLYGLKQASTQWNIELTQHFLAHGYTQSKRDYSMFTKKHSGKQTIILVYVDDLLISGDDAIEIQKIKDSLDTAFTIKDLGAIRYFLGIEVSRTSKGTMLNQRKFILDILKSTGMESCKPSKFPFPKGIKLSTDTGEMMADPESYRRIIGKLLYLNLTRPDISYSVQQLSQFISAPRLPHFQAAIHVVKYLAGTLDWGLYYAANQPLHLTAFCDSDWGSCAFSARSLTGYCVFLGNSLISWKTKKQKTVSKSSTEAEYRCMSQTTSEIVWVHGLLEDLSFIIPQPIDLYCDNKSANHLAYNPIFHERTKHLKVDCHYVREHIQSGFLKVLHIKSFLQLADLMTKSLSEHQHNHLSSKLGLVSSAPS